MGLALADRLQHIVYEAVGSQFRLAQRGGARPKTACSSQHGLPNKEGISRVQNRRHAKKEPWHFLHPAMLRRRELAPPKKP